MSPASPHASSSGPNRPATDAPATADPSPSTPPTTGEDRAERDDRPAVGDERRVGGDDRQSKADGDDRDGRAVGARSSGHHDPAATGTGETQARASAGHRWELLACGLRGHQTYAPTDDDALAARLHTQAPQGQAWRCLRCGTYVLGEPRRRGPETQAPTPRRGRELRDAVIMRFLSLERLGRALLLAVLAYGIWRFDGAKDSLHRAFQSYLPDVGRLLDRAGVNVYDTAPFRLASRVFATGHHTIMLVVLAVAAYAAIETLEGIGLWVMRRWGEYVAVVGTSVFLPYEIYDIVEKVSVLRIGTFLINLAAVVWLVWSKRLFGVRGGAAAYEQARQGTSILELERAAA